MPFYGLRSWQGQGILRPSFPINFAAGIPYDTTNLLIDGVTKFLTTATMRRYVTHLYKE
jgi:hypothetical protein